MLLKIIFLSLGTVEDIFKARSFHFAEQHLYFVLSGRTNFKLTKPELIWRKLKVAPETPRHPFHTWIGHQSPEPNPPGVSDFSHWSNSPIINGLKSRTIMKKLNERRPQRILTVTKARVMFGFGFYDVGMFDCLSPLLQEPHLTNDVQCQCSVQE